MPDLLIELFSEEIPARMQARAAADLQKLVTEGLVQAGLTYAHAAAFHTARRLTLTLEGVPDASPALREDRKGPRVDAPEQALAGFLRATGLRRDQLQARDDKKGQVWFASIHKPGRPAADIVAEVLETTIRAFPWPKSMRWGAGSLRWVRPLHSILCILYDESGHSVVPLKLDGITATDTTEGHRFLSQGRFAVTSFQDYEAKLKRARVILRADERADHIWIEAHNRAFAQGLEVVEDAALLAEIAGLVEWPVVLMGDIGADFLGLPPEVLQTSMRAHQKFFSVRNPKTSRIEKFVTVANIETADHGATILAGNQKVLAARLSDARFFWENDLRTVEREGMKAWRDKLADVTFHAKLGSQAERIERIAALAREIAPLVGAKPDLAAEAARIAKADLASEMVYEFPELQGTMGKYYARAAGHDDGVPEACEEHYSPLGPSDAVPTNPISVAVALADKIDTLTGFWAIDEKPTGSKDPYALRRAALGVIRLVLGNELRVELKGQIVQVGATMHTSRLHLSLDDHGPAVRDLLTFFHDRLKVHLKGEGIRHDVIDACLADPAGAPSGATPNNDDLTLLIKRARALSALLKTDDGENLLQGFKRANNILTQAETQDGVEYSFGADAKFADDPTEHALFAALDTAETAIAPAMQTEDFETAMHAMAALRVPIDAFFDTVQVNTDSQILRRNRLNLLHRIRTICLSVADLTRIEG